MINSKENKLVKQIKSLHMKKCRQELGLFIVEGVKMVQEAILYNQNIGNILVCTELLKMSNTGTELLAQIESLPIEVIKVSKSVFEYISDTDSPQGVAATVKIPKNKNYDFNSKGMYLLLDNIQDPGNLGTMIRTSDAAGVQALFLSRGCVDVYNSKVIRSTMGSIFRVKIFEDHDLNNIILQMKANNIRVVATTPNSDVNYHEIDYTDNEAVIIGNESNGIGDELIDIADIKVKIPMVKGVQSLNVSVAAAILVYEISKKYLN